MSLYLETNKLRILLYFTVNKKICKCYKFRTLIITTFFLQIFGFLNNFFYCITRNIIKCSLISLSVGKFLFIFIFQITTGLVFALIDLV